MINNQNTYNPQHSAPMPPMPPGLMMPPPMREALLKFPSWLNKYAVVVYVMALLIVTGMYSAYSLPWYYLLSGVVSVTLFFGYGMNLAKRYAVNKIKREANFEKSIFGVAFLLRAIWVITIYAIFMTYYGDAFGFENADATYYNDLGQFVAGLIDKGNFHFYDEISKWSGNEDIADMGYGVYVGFIYYITDNSIIAVRLLKCIWSSLTVVLLYRLAKRNFGAQVARIAAIMVTLWPNFWYYCGAHLKETEMVFLAVLFVEQADQMLRSRQFTVWKVAPVLLIGAIIFTFRTPLGLVAILALLFTIVMASSRVVKWGKRIIIGALAVLLIGVTMGNRIEEQARGLIEQVQGGDYQKGNMEWRGEREHGNVFAKYAGATVFAPMIFTIPFPTMVRPFDGQDVQQLLNGGNFVKNIMSFFVIFALGMLLLTGRWREHLLPLSFMLGYVVVLVMSSFAHSERFHQPIMMFEFMFAAYGMSIVTTKKKYRQWFLCWCIIMFIACLGWNWFKLKGRGMI